MFDDIVKKKTNVTWTEELDRDLPKIVAEDIINVQPMRDDIFKMGFTIKKTKIEPKVRELKVPKLEDDTPDPAPLFDNEKIEFDWGNKNTFADARYTMAEWFNYDEGLEIAYRSNIAMFLNDRCGITDHEERNKLAKDLMKLLWG